VVCRAEINDALHPIGGDVGKAESGGRCESAGILQVWCTQTLCFRPVVGPGPAGMDRRGAHEDFLE
jgi:hypothetical protein